MARMEIHERIEHDFRNHPPSTLLVGAALDQITEFMVGAAHVLVGLVPEGREQSLMLTALEQAEMYAKAGVARNRDAITDGPLSPS